MALRVPAPDGTKAADGLPVMVLPPGTELAAGYRLHFLAVGGMSVVYRAEGTKAGKPPVLFAKEVASSESREVVSLVQEKSILERLRHPGIVAVHELFEEDGHYYLMTDFIEGESLDRVISPFEGVFLQEKVVLGWGAELAEIFAYLHRQDPPIVYRDLKPRNVMKDRAGRLHLVDFGIARYHKEGKAKDTESLGTAATASPEHYMGQTDHRSDIFTLGATLHFLLSNGSRKRRAPFEFPPIRTLNGQVSEGAEAVLRKCLEVEPGKRYASMDELRHALDRCLGKVPSVRAGEPTPYDGPMETNPLPPEPVPGRSLTPLVVVAALLLGLGGGLLAGRSGRAPVVVETRLAVETPADGETVAPVESPGAGETPGLEETPVMPVAVGETPRPVVTPSLPVAGRPSPTRSAPPVAATPTPRPQPTARPETPSYPVRKPTPRPVESSAPAPEAEPDVPPAQGADRFYRILGAGALRAPRTAPVGERAPGGGTWVRGPGFRMLVPAGFEQVDRGTEHELLFLQGTRRDTAVLRVRWMPELPDTPEGMAERFVAANPVLSEGDSSPLVMMGNPGVLWEGDHKALGLDVHTQAALWRAQRQSFLAMLTGRADAVPAGTFREFCQSIVGE